MKEVFINSEYITLAQFLKLEGFIGSGGEAKYFLQEVEVELNGELENRRGKKLYSNDVIKLEGNEFIIINENEKFKITVLSKLFIYEYRCTSLA